MNDDRLAARVGAAVLAALGLAVVLVLLLAGRHFGPGLRVHVEIGRVGNLQVGAKVRLAGLELGEIEDIRLIGAPSRAVLDLWIARRHSWLVTTTTDFFLSQEGLLGEPYLGVAGRPGEPGPPLADGATVRGIDPPRIDHLLITIDENLHAATSIMRDGIPEGAALGAAMDELERTLDSLEPTAPLWSAGARLYVEGKAFSGAIPAGATARVSALASALRPPPLADRLRRLARELDRLPTSDPRLRRFADALARAGDLVARAQQALAIADELYARVAAGRGSLGAFLSDVELADEMKDMTRTLKRQPWLTLGKPKK